MGLLQKIFRKKNKQQTKKTIEERLRKYQRRYEKEIEKSLATAMGNERGFGNLKIRKNSRMSCFRRIFGKKKKYKFPSTEEVVQKLEDHKAELIEQQENLEKQIEECITIAKTNATENRRAALRALQNKKRLENKLQQIQNTLTSLEQQKDTLEDAKMNAKILTSMKKAGKVIKKANKKLDSDKVQHLMDKMSQQHDIGSEISRAIRNSLVLDADEDELAKELDQIQDEVIKQRLPSIPVEVDIVFTRNGEEDTRTQSDSTTTAFSATIPSANGLKEN